MALDYLGVLWTYSHFELVLMAFRVLSDGIQEMMSMPLLTERQVIELLDPILRKRPCLILLVFSLLIRRLLLPGIGPDAHNIALIYSFCLNRTHAGIFDGLSLALRTHATLLLRFVSTEGRLRFEDQHHSVHALVQHKGALLLIFKTLAFTPWLSREDVVVLVQAPCIQRLRADEKHCRRQEQIAKRANFVTASELIVKIAQTKYLPLGRRYSTILRAIMQGYDQVLSAVGAAETVSLFQKYLGNLRAERFKAAQNITRLGPYFKWRHYRDQILFHESRKRLRDQPTIIRAIMIDIRGFVEHFRTTNSYFTLIYRKFLRRMLQLSTDTIPLESELEKQEGIIEALLSNNIRTVAVSLPVNNLRRCHDMLVLASLIRQDVLNCSGTALFLLGTSYGAT